ncbi:glycosyl transferase family 1 [Lentzea sp. NBRC 105346]|nr:glycosyl transferase family 1 [Lentzea sp. NBRC 105346]
MQPYLALAAALRAAGHRPVLAAPARYERAAASFEVPFAPLDDGLLALRDEPLFRRAVGRGMRPVAVARAAARTARESMRAAALMLRDVAKAGAGGADVVVHHPGLQYAPLVAEKLGVPSVVAPLQPGWVPTSEFRALRGQGASSWPGWANRASYRVLYRLAALPRGPIRKWRQEVLGLPPSSGPYNPLLLPDGSPATVLQAYSRHLFPSTSDSSPSVHTTGFWFLPAPASWTPPPRLTAFLEAGPPPVYLGFGSMVGAEPAATGRLVAEAVRRAGVRAVVAAGWGGVQITSSSELYFVPEVPHAWLFPRVAAIVHHSGGGTSGAALAAGRPQVLCPHLSDQPLWANRMHALGVAPSPLPFRRLTATALASAIRRAVDDPSMAAAADELGRLVRAEDGTSAAVSLIERS